MTESQLMEVAQPVWANAISLGAIFITLLSGYLIVAYTVGATLNSGQIRIVNGLYIALALFAHLASLKFMREIRLNRNE